MSGMIPKPARRDLDRGWFARSFVGASLADLGVTSSSVALDATDIETWGRLRWPQSGSDPREPPVLWIDVNGRSVRTADHDPSDGHRLATNSRCGGIFTGYDVHNFVQGSRRALIRRSRERDLRTRCPEPW
jgi:hypothetical protein